jgi:hypothetical protein
VGIFFIRFNEKKCERRDKTEKRILRRSREKHDKISKLLVDIARKRYTDAIIPLVD